MQLDFPSFSPCKDPAGLPTLKTGTARFFWRIFTQHLTEAGRWFAIPTGVFGVYGALSMMIQGYVVFCYLIALWMLAFVGMLIPTNVTALMTAATTIRFKILTFTAHLLSSSVAPWDITH